jgi:flagellar biosynthesis/type III secretory pathway protein FliH
MREPRLLACRENTIIQAEFRPAGKASGADIVSTIGRLIEAEAHERARLANQRRRLAKRIWDLRKRRREAMRSALERRVSKRAASIRRKMERTLNEHLARGREQIFDLSLRIAKAIVQQEIDQNPASLVGKLRKLLAAFPDQAVQIRCSIAESAALANELGASSPHVKFDSSSSLDRGLATIESQGGTIEVNWMNELMQIEKSLRDSLLKPDESSTSVMG